MKPYMIITISLTLKEVVALPPGQDATIEAFHRYGLCKTRDGTMWAGEIRTWHDMESFKFVVQQEMPCED